jgi:zinc transporter
MAIDSFQDIFTSQSGLVWGYRFSPDGLGSAIDVTAVRETLISCPVIPADGFLWLHFNLSQAATEKWLRANLSLPEEYFEAWNSGLRSTRIEQIDNGLIAVVNDVLHGFSFDPSEISTVWLWVTPTLVISGRRKSLKSVDRLRQSVNSGEKITTSFELLSHLLRDQADVLIGIVRETVTRVDKIEDDLLAERLNYKRANLGNLRRVLVRLQRLMAPEPAALFRLLQRPPQWIDELDLQDLRQSSEEFSAVLVDMASLQERIKLLQEEIAAMVNERNSRSLYTLTVFTVMALPINMIAGLFGMNVAGIPMSDESHGFWVVVGLVACVTGIAYWALTRQRRDR